VGMGCCARAMLVKQLAAINIRIEIQNNLFMVVLIL
jgi:hypothetical protein